MYKNKGIGVSESVLASIDTADGCVLMGVGVTASLGWPFVTGCPAVHRWAPSGLGRCAGRRRRSPPRTPHATARQPSAEGQWGSREPHSRRHRRHAEQTLCGRARRRRWCQRSGRVCSRHATPPPRAREARERQFRRRARAGLGRQGGGALALCAALLAAAWPLPTHPGRPRCAAERRAVC